MLSARTKVSCEVTEASICGGSEIVLSLAGSATLTGRPGTLRGRLVFLPAGLSPDQTDSLGSLIAHRLLERGRRMELIVAESQIWQRNPGK